MGVGNTSAARLAQQVAGSLRSHGYKAYLVGGCVRDLLLGAEPKDYDLSTDAPPHQVLALFPGAHRVGAHFGVVLVREGEAQVEVATFRKDHEYHDGRHPHHVTFEQDPREDVLRRDFTINALLLDPATGEVIDYAGGRRDLRFKIVRAIGEPEKRFREDHLRMLRAVRLAARLDFEIESETEAAIVRLHPLILDVSAERIRDELMRILVEGAARRGFELLDRTGLLGDILPEVAAMKGVEQPPDFHPEGDVWTHTLLMLERLESPTATLALGVLLHDVGKPPTFRVEERIRFDGHVEVGVELTRGILSRLRFSNDEIRRVEALVDSHMRFKDARRMKESTLKRFLRLEHFEEHLELHRLDCESSHGNLDHYEYVRRKREEFGEEQIKPPRLLTGADLISAGYAPGPEFGRVLQAVEDAQLEGRVQSKDEALALARALLAAS
ncbi:MAG: CCA tRNA nucleotidyltransferase [Acidobacteria bacterium]|nr:CCA tRNA nucleotidyltransferase [Acidobacteriota bacterium]MBI3281896.1 CCA tRNA nucleotidyltransferase [Acidobacteriota bacterium]